MTHRSLYGLIDSDPLPASLAQMIMIMSPEIIKLVIYKNLIQFRYSCQTIGGFPVQYFGFIGRLPQHIKILEAI